MNPVALLISFLWSIRCYVVTVAGPSLKHVTLFGLRTPSKFSQYMDPHPCLYVCKAMSNCTEKVINGNKERKQEVGREMGWGAIGAIFLEGDNWVWYEMDQNT